MTNCRFNRIAVMAVAATAAGATFTVGTPQASASPAPASAVQVHVAARAGGLDLFVRGLDGQPYHLRARPDGNPVTGAAWEPMGGAVLRSPTATWNSGDSSLDAFAVGLDGFIYHDTYRDSWSGWAEVDGGGVATDSVEVARQPDGRMDLFVRGLDGHPYWLELNADGRPTVADLGWLSIGSVVVGAPAATLDLSGTLHVFAVRPNGRVYHVIFSHSASWTEVPGGGVVKDVTEVAFNPLDNTMDLFVTGLDGVPYTERVTPKMAL